MADVVLPSSASWCETEGTVTNSERRVQRVRKALEPPGEARDDTWILCELARRLGHDWGRPDAEEIWDELRSLSPMHRGMSYERLEELGGIQWPCPDEEHPGSPFLHERLWDDPVEGRARAVQRRRGEAAVRGARRRLPDPAHDRAPARVVQHRRAVEPVPLAAAPRRVARPLARGRRAAAARRRRDRAGLVAARLGRGAGADRPLAARRARVHDVPLPRRGRRQPADDRRDRPEVGHGRVQGGRDPGREARARGARRTWRASRSRRGSGGRPDGPVASSRAPSRPLPSGRRSTPCSDRRRPAGRAPSAPRGRRATRQRRSRRARAPPSAAAGAARAPGAHRLDQPGRAQLPLPAADVPPADAYGVATFYALLAVEPRPRARRPRLRGPRLPLPRLART